jgi:SNF2 family DNA or RNA helicase
MTLTNWQHQDEAALFLEGRNAGMLGMDMGTGKSRVAIQWLDSLDAKNVLLLMPKVVLSVWPDQFALHSDRNWYVFPVDKKHSVSRRQQKSDDARVLAEAMGRPFALCVNYEAAWREPFNGWLLRNQWDAIIFDESHRIKAPGGKASRFASRLKVKSLRRLALTGTPMPHSPLDLYAQWRAIDSTILGTSFQRFKNRYAVMGGYEGRQVIGFRNIEELQRLVGQHTFVVNKRDVLDLPPLTKERLKVELDPATYKKYDEFEKDLVLELDRGLVTVDNALTKLLRLQQITSGYVKTDDGDLVHLGSEKYLALVDLLQDIPDDEPVVVFCRFHVDLDNIHKAASTLGRKSFELSGRADSHEIWKRDTGGSVLAVQIQSGGVGIDLTRACYGVYYSLGFSLGDYDQSLSRLERPGMDRPVTIYHLVAPGTVDVKVHQALRDKRNVVEAVIGGFGVMIGRGQE